MNGDMFSRYLLDEQPVTFHATLAKEIGLNEAILLQKINLWLNCKPHNACGRSWIYNTYKSWQEQLPFMSESTIKRTMKNLIDQGFVIVNSFNKSKFDRTLWYSIDYDKLNNFMEERLHRKCQTDTIRECQNDTTYTNEYTMNNIYIEQSGQIGFDRDTFSPPKNEKKQLEKEKEKVLLSHFELIWERYPNKKGKVKAREYFMQWVKGRKIGGTTIKLTDEQMCRAALAYIKECEDEKRDLQYIKHGDTFFNKAILDYVDDLDE